MATIGKLVVSLQANSAKLVSELSKSQKMLKSWASRAAKAVGSVVKVFGLLGAVGLGAFVIAVNKSAAAIDNITKAAGKLQFPIEDYQRFAFIAAKSNIPMENFGKSMQKMLKTIGDARDGLTTATGAFDQLGLSADHLAQLSPSDQFALIAERMKEIPVHADRVKVAMDIFGRSGADLLNVFAGDVKGIGEEFDSLGIAITDQQAAMVATFQDSKTTLNTLFKGFSENVTAEVSPVFNTLVEEVTAVIKSMGGIKPIAQDIARWIGEAVSASISHFGFLLDAIEGAKLVIGKTFEFIGTAIGEQLAAWSEGNLTIDLDKSALPAIAADFQKGIDGFGEAGRAADAFAAKIDESTSKIGGGEGLNDGHVQAFIQQQKDAAQQVITQNQEVAASGKKLAETLEEVSKSKAWKDIFGKEDVTARSNQFDQYAKLAKANIESGSQFAGSNLEVLKEILRVAESNGGQGFSNNNLFEKLDLQGMADVITGLEAMSKAQATSAPAQNEQIKNLITAGTVSQNVMDKLIQSQSQQKELGKLELTVSNGNGGGLKGNIFGDPEFLENFKREVARDLNDEARADGS